MMQPWRTRVMCEGSGYRPRQFEYHPSTEGLMLFGTIRGEVVLADATAGRAIKTFSKGLSSDTHDPILGLSWLRKSPSRFLVGSSFGVLSLCDLEAGTSHQQSSASGAAAAMDVGEGSRVVRNYPAFERLTSVHGNCEDALVLVSGYSHGVRLFDLNSGAVVRDFTDIHDDHINISRFANHCPYLFATSSFDTAMKCWDVRAPTPIYTTHSSRGHVMVCFSPDDVYLLTSAVDNEITEHLAVDGREFVKLRMASTGLEENFTRAYYNSSGTMILSGSSEEQVVRLHCSQTGELMEEAEMYPHRKHNSLYIQSLRGDPCHDHRFSILVNYRDASYPLEIVTVDLLQPHEAHDKHTQACGSHLLATKRLNADMERLADMTALPAGAAVSGHSLQGEGAVTLVVGNEPFAIVAPVIAARCSVLKSVLSEGLQSGRRLLLLPPPFSSLSPSTFRLVLHFLYTDTLKLTGGAELGEQKALLKVLEPLLHAARLLELPRLFTMAEWHARQAVSVETVLCVSSMARRVGALSQLLPYCVYFATYHQEVLWPYHQRSQEGLEEEVRWLQGLVKAEMANGHTLRPVVTTFSSPFSDGSYDEYSDQSVGTQEEEDEEEEEEEDEEGVGMAELDVMEEPPANNHHHHNHQAPPPNHQAAMPPPPADSSSPPLPPPSVPAPGSVIPKHTGHTCSTVLSGLMLLLGGGNRRQFHSFRNLLLFNPSTTTWSKVVARGDVPPALIYHSACPLQDPHTATGTEHLIIFGGSNHTRTPLGPPLTPRPSRSISSAFSLCAGTVLCSTLVPRPGLTSAPVTPCCSARRLGPRTRNAWCCSAGTPLPAVWPTMT